MRALLIWWLMGALAAVTACLAAPKGYVCYRAQAPIGVDGRLDDRAWQDAPWTDPFLDIEGEAKPRPRFRTRVKMLWDSKYFYIAAELEEPHVWATLTRHDSVIFHDNDFEVFIDPNGDNHEYYELEINALNTTWDLFLPRPYKDGGQARNDWEIPGMKTAVRIDGTLNNPAGTDRGWTVEIALPWKALAACAHRPAPPADGDQWRINFSRVEWLHDLVDGRYRKRPGTREDNWVWSPQGAINMHMPERWGYVQFSTARPGTASFRPDPTAPARELLHRIYYAQKEYRKKYGRWAATLQELGLDDAAELRITPDGFEAATGGLRIRQDALLSSDP
ncbi:MAG: carbohydrate-binding family 9-like protein [Acidobacteria bacterium]|nr:carbohydrate-binding family 9-like protein [Acidobacteriota bacterium]